MTRLFLTTLFIGAAICGFSLADTFHADDPYTAALWHCNVINNERTPDDNSSGRSARDLRLDLGSTINLSSNGAFGNAIVFPSGGGGRAQGATTWPGPTDGEFKLDGWFYFNSNGLPSNTGAATMYVFYISDSGASGVIVEMFVHTDDTLRFGAFDNSSGNKRIAQLKLRDASAGIDLTGRWIRVIAQWDNTPGQRGPRLRIVDGATAYEDYVNTAGTMRLANRTMYVGHMGGRGGDRSFRGMMDEIKLSWKVADYEGAHAPSPANNAVVPPSSEQRIEWRKGAGAETQSVRFGTSSNMNNNVVIAEDVTGEFLDVSTQPGMTYYWRVDTHAGGQTLIGDAWRFSTESGRAYGPSPGNNATNITFDIDTLTLGWTGAAGATGFDVYFGESEPLAHLGTTSGTTMETPALEPYTRYYWRVDSHTNSGLITGDAWNFRTRVLAFPGAEGFGRWTRGGRGGSVYRVTNLDDSGPGSFRDAVSQPNRYVIFDVGGVINIDARVVISRNVTIAGQTAPGDGVVIYGNGVSYSNANDAITRHMRYRMGRGGDSGADGIAVASGTDMIWDHVSASWGRDETFSIASSSILDGKFTIQNCIIAQGLDTHSCGSLIELNRTSIFRTLYIDNHTRNPKVKHVNDFINNVVYNWRVAGYILGDSAGASYANIINNYFIEGPSTSSAPFNRANENFQLYAADNYHDSNRNGVLDGSVVPQAGYGPVTWMSQPFDYPTVETVLNPAIAAKVVASRSGASIPARDRTDERLITELLSYGTMGQIISDENNAPMYGVGPVAGGEVPVDSDGDGMPDYWEIAVGTDPYTQDHNGDISGNGYTNLEEYLNWLAGPHAKGAVNSHIDVDLGQYATGFGAGRSFTVQDAVNGQVELLADGETARFTPDADFTGLASFGFTIIEGGSFSDRVGVLVMNTAGMEVTPDPMTWQTPPEAAGLTSITMTATQAVSAAGVEYYFRCLTPGGSDSGWQASNTWTDTGLKPDTAYTYAVKARSKGDPDIVTGESEPATASTNPVPSIGDPVAQWLFDEASGDVAHDELDISHGTVLSGNDGLWQPGRFGNALHFNGAGARVYVPSNAVIDSDYEDLSISFWIKDPPQRSEGQHNILVKGTWVNPPDSGKRYEFYRKKTSTYDEFRFCVDDDVIKSEVAVDAPPFATGDWVHVVGVRDTAANQLRLYADGVPIDTSPDATLGISQDEPMYIGDAAFANAIDDLRIYKFALSDEQIQALALGAYVDDVYPPTPNPMLWQVEPHAIRRSEITMIAADARDDSGVEYYFANVTEPAFDSGWQSSAAWTNTGLQPGTTYSYAVMARDLSEYANETGWSEIASATTPLYDCLEFPLGDLNLDCKVDLVDLAMLAQQWLSTEPTPADLNDDGVVDLLDVMELAGKWLECGREPVEACLY